MKTEKESILRDPVRAVMNWAPARAARLILGAVICLCFFLYLTGQYSEYPGTAVIALAGAASLAVMLAFAWRPAKEKPLIVLLVMAFALVMAVMAHYSLLDRSLGRMTKVLTPLADTLWNYDLNVAMSWEEGYWSAGYLIVMSLFSRLENFSLLYAVKLLDLVCLSLAACAVSCLARRRGAGVMGQFGAMLAAMLLPTMLLNGGLWAHCDAIFAMLTLWGLYMLLSDRPLAGSLFWGAAIAFKLQSAFVFPLAIVLFMKRKMGLRHIAAIFLAFLVFHIPMLMNGQSLPEVLDRYNKQILITSYGEDYFTASDEETDEEAQEAEAQEAEQADTADSAEETADSAAADIPTHSELAEHAASVYSLMSVASVREFSGMGLYLGIACALAVVFALLRSRRELTADVLLTAAFLLACGLPLILPQSNARFLYLAGLLSLPRVNSRLRLAEACGLELISICCYVSAIFSTDAAPLSILPDSVLSLIGIVIACAAAWELFCALTGRDLKGHVHEQA